MSGLRCLRGMRTLMMSLSALICSGFLTTAMATKYAQPKDHEVPSANGKFVLKISAETGEHRLCEGDKVLWKFKREVWHNDYFVSNDGQCVLWVAWRHVKEEATEKGEAVAVYSPEGKVLSKTFNQISKPRARGMREIGPIGDFWRLWRTGLEREREVVTITVTGKNPLIIDLANPLGD